MDETLSGARINDPNPRERESILIIPPPSLHPRLYAMQQDTRHLSQKKYSRFIDDEVFKPRHGDTFQMHSTGNAKIQRNVSIVRVVRRCSTSDPYNLLPPTPALDANLCYPLHGKL